MKKINTLDVCYIALFTAIITVCGWICIPIGEVKYTLQLLGVLLCGSLLGWKRGLLSVMAYVGLGSLGIPVFSGFTTGLLASPTSGYIVGFLFTVICAGMGNCVKTNNRILNLILRAAWMTAGVFSCYLFGTVWFMLYQGTTLFFLVFCSCVASYFWFDGIKIVLVLILTDKLKEFMK